MEEERKVEMTIDKARKILDEICDNTGYSGMNPKHLDWFERK